MSKLNEPNSNGRRPHWYQNQIKSSALSLPICLRFNFGVVVGFFWQLPAALAIALSLSLASQTSLALLLSIALGRTDDWSGPVASTTRYIHASPCLVLKGVYPEGLLRKRGKKWKKENEKKEEEHERGELAERRMVNKKLKSDGENEKKKKPRARQQH